MFDGVVGVKKSYPCGGVLYYEGDVSSKVIVLVSGGCKAYKVSRDSEIFLYSLCPGAVISDLGGVALNSVEFTADSEVMIYESDALIDASISNAALLLGHSIERAKLLNKALNVGMVFDAAGKVADMLLSDVDLFNELKRKIVAERLNISSETLSRTLNRLLKSNFIEIVDSEVIVLDRDELLSFL